MEVLLQKVQRELARYEHPLFEFETRGKASSVEIEIRFKNPSLPVHTYSFEMHPRDIEHPQFCWTFQRQLYDCLHDYIIEMFTRNPQMKEY